MASEAEVEAARYAVALMHSGCQYNGGKCAEGIKHCTCRAEAEAALEAAERVRAAEPRDVGEDLYQAEQAFIAEVGRKAE